MEEDAVEIPLSEAGRLLAEFRAEGDQRREVRAKEAGFSSWDEHNKYLIEESHRVDQEYEMQLDEKCALLGKTREQLYEADPQRFIPDDGGLPQCDCDDHLIPFFCPKSLVEYRSMDQSDWLRCLDDNKNA
ncbi:hypothetical protein GJ744_006410 [Endocarpon pusillum]|uniref:Uncharacterized protein n=1 Tax=Endocarpon pusillum TaxID=364733 RepID=A0A8H7E4U9_9EURO|nr:hypothetical protein GJ744_006410 [Endocarpon pusillum]